MFSFGQVRETFFIPETDPECYERKASRIHRYMMLPHTVMQHMDFSGEYSRYLGYNTITYDRKGRLYVG